MVRSLFRDKRLRSVPRVLIVEDSKTLAGLLKQAFNDNQYRAETAFDGREAAEKFNRTDYDLVVLDYHLPDTLGDKLLLLFREKRPQTAVIIMTADPQPEVAHRCMKSGAFACLRKPFETEYLLEVCAKAR